MRPEDIVKKAAEFVIDMLADHKIRWHEFRSGPDGRIRLPAGRTISIEVRGSRIKMQGSPKKKPRFGFMPPDCDTLAWHCWVAFNRSAYDDTKFDCDDLIFNHGYLVSIFSPKDALALGLAKNSSYSVPVPGYGQCRGRNARMFYKKLLADNISRDRDRLIIHYLKGRPLKPARSKFAERILQ